MLKLTSQPSPLQKAMFANAVFSFVCGVIFLLARKLLMPHIPLAPLLWTLFGAGLILFSAQLVIMVKSTAWAEKLIIPVIFSDIAWVILTCAALAYYQSRISPLGNTLIIAVNMMVAALAWFQAQAYLEQGKK